MLCDLVLHVTYKEKTVDFKVKHPLLSKSKSSLHHSGQSCSCEGLPHYGGLNLTKCTERFLDKTEVQQGASINNIVVLLFSDTTL